MAMLISPESKLLPNLRSETPGSLCADLTTGFMTIQT